MSVEIENTKNSQNILWRTSNIILDRVKRNQTLFIGLVGSMIGLGVSAYIGGFLIPQIMANCIFGFTGLNFVKQIYNFFNQEETIKVESNSYIPSYIESPTILPTIEATLLPIPNVVNKDVHPKPILKRSKKEKNKQTIKKVRFAEVNETIIQNANSTLKSSTPSSGNYDNINVDFEYSLSFPSLGGLVNEVKNSITSFFKKGNSNSTSVEATLYSETEINQNDAEMMDFEYTRSPTNTSKYIVPPRPSRRNSVSNSNNNTLSQEELKKKIGFYIELIQKSPKKYINNVEAVLQNLAYLQENISQTPDSFESDFKKLTDKIENFDLLYEEHLKNLDHQQASTEVTRINSTLDPTLLFRYAYLLQTKVERCIVNRNGQDNKELEQISENLEKIKVKVNQNSIESSNSNLTKKSYSTFRDNLLSISMTY